MQKQYTIGIDVGGTNIKAVLFDGKKIIVDDTLRTPQDSFMHFSVMLSALIDPMIERVKREKAVINGIGLGVPGLIDFEKKKIIKTPNIPILDGVDIEKRLEEKFNLNVSLDNDASCFLRAEMKIGVGKKYKNAFGITLGTGIGGAWWLDDKIYSGSHFSAGEPARMITNFDHPIELEDAYKKLLNNNPVKTANEAYKGEGLSQKAYEEMGAYLGVALANIANLIDPEIFIIGGSVVNSGDLFLGEARKQMKKYIMNTEAKKKIKIVKTKLGENAGAIGAALLI